MSRQLQDFGIIESAYDRPTQSWVCGWADDGNGCPLGPDVRGRCRSTFECNPNKSGDRWICTRPELLGGRCTTGPLPDGTCCRPIAKCQPKRSSRAQRGMLVTYAVAVTLGFILLLPILGSTRDAFVSPGDLSAQHGTIANSCISCHTAAGGGSGGWVTTALRLGDGVGQNVLCLDCHNLGAPSMFPHGKPVQELAAVTKASHPSATQSLDFPLSLAKLGPGVPAAQNGELACATCHQEHRGKDFNLSRLSNQNCQICHVNQFKSLSMGHPEFEQFPYDRRTRIRFDHVSHMDKHFKKKGSSKDFSCTGCHQPDSQGNYMMVTAMETSCAGCHNHANEVKGRDIDFFAVPKLDRKLLSKRSQIGDWPKFARQKLTPFMKFLLSGGDLSASDLKLDLSNLQGKAQLAAGEKVVWAVKKLFFDLRSRGHEGLKARLSKAAEMAGYELEQSQLNRMLAQIPAETVASATDEWFPLLRFEIALRNSNKSNVSHSNIKKTYPESTAVLAGLRQKRPPKEAAKKKEDEEEVDLKALLAGDGEEKKEEDADLKALLAGDSKEKEEGDADLKALLAGGGEDKDEKEEKTGLEDLKTGAEWATAGGWYRSGFAIRYRTFGHGNPFIQSWLDVIAGLGGKYSAAGNGQGASLITAIGVETTKCLKCHGLDAEKGSRGRARISWTAKRHVPNLHMFNRFSHKPHFSLANLMGGSNNKGCLTCHRIDGESSQKFQEAFGSDDMLKIWAPDMAFASNFEGMTKSTCTKCHVPSEVGNSCITCHNYHVGPISPAFLHPVKTGPALPKN